MHISFFRFSTILLFLFSSLHISAQGDPRTLETLDFHRAPNFRHVPQTQSNWCWAATLATVINSYNNADINVCDMASLAVGANCCAAPAACNVQNSLYQFDALVRPYGLRAEEVGKPDWPELREYIRKGPVIIRVESDIGQGHFVVLVGFDFSMYRDTGNLRRSMVVSDPMYGYYVGDPQLIGYTITWEDLLNGKMLDYRANWTHTVVFY